MQCSGQKATLLTGGKPFRELDDRSWDAARRIEDMDKAGVAVQVLSPMPELLSYWLADDAAALICDTVNHHIAAMASHHPGRFRGLGAVPMQNPGKAASGLRHLKSRFGLDGVEIGSNINGLALGDPLLEPFFAAAEAENIAVFVHAIHPIAKTPDMSPQYASVVLFPVEIAMAAASLLAAGTLERYPGLRIAFSHGGGALAAMLGRLDQGWRTGAFAERIEIQPSVTARAMFVDGNVYDPALLHHLATDMAPGRIFAGSDYPYRIMETDVAGLIARAGLGDAGRRSVEHGAALAFLDGGSAGTRA